MSVGIKFPLFRVFKGVKVFKMISSFNYPGKSVQFNKFQLKFQRWTAMVIIFFIPMDWIYPICKAFISILTGIS